MATASADNKGDVHFWNNYSSASDTVLRSVKRVWDVQAVGDLDGDGFGDLVWRYVVADSPDTGVSYVWFTDGTAVRQVRKRGGAPLTWTLLGAADLNGDGAADMIYVSPDGLIKALMATPGRTCANLSAGNVPSGHTALKFADFTGNGRGDILIRNAVTGATQLLSLNATGLSLPPYAGTPDDQNASCTASTLTVSNNTISLPDVDPTWQYYASADLNGDGIADIVWVKPDGGLTVWLMNPGGTIPNVIANAGTAPDGFRLFPRATYSLSLSLAGTGSGTVTSAPAAINCGTTCTGNFESGTTVTLTAAATAGSQFAGWSGACSGAASCVVTIDAATNVSATFSASSSSFLLTVATSGIGSVSSSSHAGTISCGSNCSATFNAGALVTLVAAAGFNNTFVGWSGACTGTGTCTVTMDAAKNVVATFSSLLTYSLSYSVTGSGNSISASPPGGSCFGFGILCWSYAAGTVVTLTAVPGIGSTFTGWSGACSGTGTCVVTMDASKNVAATFTSVLPSFQLAVTTSGDGTVSSSSPLGAINCGATCSATFNAGTIVTLTAATGFSSTFTGWSGACTGTGTCTVTMDSAKSVTASFSLSVTYALNYLVTGTGNTISASPAGTACFGVGTPCWNYAGGTIVTLTAVPGMGSTFTGWSGACSGTGACVVTMDMTKTVAAAFSASSSSFALSVMTSGTGIGSISSMPAAINCGATCSATFNAGTVVTLTAAAGFGSAFTGWGGACTGMGACTVTMDTAKSVTASFSLPVTYTLNYSVTGSGTISSSPPGGSCLGFGTLCWNYAGGTVVTLTAVPSGGSTFTGWSGVCSGSGACVITVDATKSVAATFSP